MDELCKPFSLLLFVTYEQANEYARALTFRNLGVWSVENEYGDVCWFTRDHQLVASCCVLESFILV